MIAPEKLLFEGDYVARLYDVGYATPWASSRVEFVDKKLESKLVGVTTMLSFDLGLDEMELSEEGEDMLWEKKLVELGLTVDDLQLDRDGKWSVEWKDGSSHEIRAVRFYEDGHMEWRG
ncbi:MAG: hypothetical protein ACR2RB_11515 [Gammaproteobacteria bacterium]